MVNRTDLETILAEQKNAYNDAINVFMDRVKKEMVEMQDSLEFCHASIKDLQATVANKDKTIVILEKQVSDLQCGLRALTKAKDDAIVRVDHLDDKSRKNNLIIEGLEEMGKENAEQTHETVKKVFVDRLAIRNPIAIDKVHRMGSALTKNEANATRPNRPRPIIVKFSSNAERQSVLQNAKKLKGTNVYIKEDFCEGTLKKRRELLPELKAAREQGFYAFLSHDRLVKLPWKKNLSQNRSVHDVSNGDLTPTRVPEPKPKGIETVPRRILRSDQQNVDV